MPFKYYSVLLIIKIGVYINERSAVVYREYGWEIVHKNSVMTFPII